MKFQLFAKKKALIAEIALLEEENQKLRNQIMNAKVDKAVKDAKSTKKETAKKAK